MEMELERLATIVFIALTSAAVETLAGVEEIGGLVPHVAEIIHSELIVCAVEVNHDVAFVAGFRNLHACHSGSVQHFKETFLVGVSHLHHHAGILGEEDAHEVCVAELGEIYVQTAFHTSEAHFQETGDETTGGDVVTCQEKTFLYKLLHGVEGIAEIFGRSHASHVISHFSLRLSKGRTAKCQRRGGEVNVIEAALRHVLQDGIHHFADVVHLAAGADDDGARRDNLLAVGILLREGE